jgi:hypothetical protein
MADGWSFNEKKKVFEQLALSIVLQHAKEIHPRAGPSWALNNGGCTFSLLFFWFFSSSE